MTPAFVNPLQKLLIRHEGFELRPYKDTMGIPSIGVGRNLECGLSPEEVLFLLNNDIEKTRAVLPSVIPTFHELSYARQAVMIDMGFMGPRKLLEFSLLLEAIARNDWESAAKEILNSRWAKQVGARSQDVADMMLNDRMPE